VQKHSNLNKSTAEQKLDKKKVNQNRNLKELKNYKKMIETSPLLTSQRDHKNKSR
jgi:hypothetical protein